MNKWNTKGVLSEIERITENNLILVGEYVAGQTKLLTPVITGNLRDSYTYVTSKKRGKVGPAANDDNTLSKPKKLSVKIGTNVEYAIHVEFGTGKRKARRQGQLGLEYSKPAIKKLLAIR